MKTIQEASSQTSSDGADTPAKADRKPRASAATPRNIGKTIRKKRPSFTVGFRLDSYYLTLLEKGAAAYGISIHEYARQRLVELLDRQEETRIIEKIDAVGEQFSAMREDLARTLEVVLANTTKADPAAIRTWVDNNLRRE